MGKLEKVLDEYSAHFGENYPLMRTTTVLEEEIIKDIKQCIETNTKAKEPEYEDNIDY